MLHLLHNDSETKIPSTIYTGLFDLNHIPYREEEGDVIPGDYVPFPDYWYLGVWKAEKLYVLIARDVQWKAEND